MHFWVKAAAAQLSLAEHMFLARIHCNLTAWAFCYMLAWLTLGLQNSRTPEHCPQVTAAAVKCFVSIQRHSVQVCLIAQALKDGSCQLWISTKQHSKTIAIHEHHCFWASCVLLMWSLPWALFTDQYVGLDAKRWSVSFLTTKLNAYNHK